MGVVLPLERLQPQDWTATERAWLAALVDHLRHGEGGFQLEFGRSDMGEPWCVVTDPGDEVVLHAARISGHVVVHHAPEDVLTEDDDLREALRRVFGPEWLTVSPATVTPFSAGGAAVQAMLALAVMSWLEAELGLFGRGLESGESVEVPAPVERAASEQPTEPDQKALTHAEVSSSPALAPVLRATPEYEASGRDASVHRPPSDVAPAFFVSAATESSRGDGVGVALVGPTPDDGATRAAEHDIVLSEGGRAEATSGADVFVLPANVAARAGSAVDLGVVVGFDFGADRFETGDQTAVALHASETPGRFWLDVDGDGEADAWVRLEPADWGVIGPVPVDVDPGG